MKIYFNSDIFNKKPQNFSSLSFIICCDTKEMDAGQSLRNKYLT